MTDGDQCEVLEPGASLCKTEECASPGVHKNPTPSIDPNQVACGSRGTVWLDARAVRTQYL
jgi:hypothetical protein